MIRNLITALYTELAMIMVWWCWRPPRRLRQQRVRQYRRQWAAMGAKRVLGRTLVFGMRFEVRVMLA